MSKVDALSNTMRFRCSFCKKHFNKISECALHLEEKAIGSTYVSDIETIYRKGKRWVTL